MLAFNEVRFKVFAPQTVRVEEKSSPSPPCSHRLSRQQAYADSSISRVASVLFLVDGKLVLLRPVVGEEGQLKYEMRVIAQNVEYYVSMKDQPFLSPIGAARGNPPAEAENEDLFNSLWMFDGTDIKAWTDMQDVLNALSAETHRDVPTPVSTSVDFYPLSVLLEKAIVLGVEPDLVQRRDVNFSFFRFSIRVSHTPPHKVSFHPVDTFLDKSVSP